MQGIESDGIGPDVVYPEGMRRHLRTEPCVCEGQSGSLGYQSVGRKLKG